MSMPLEDRAEVLLELERGQLVQRDYLERRGYVESNTMMKLEIKNGYIYFKSCGDGQYSFQAVVNKDKRPRGEDGQEKFAFV